MTTKFIEFLDDVDCVALDATRLSDLERIELAGYRYEYEERSAILEYDGGMTRTAAELQAAKEIIVRFKL